MILIVAAMQEESKFIPELLNLKKEDDHDIFINENIVFVRSGVGKVNAAMYTQMCLSRYDIDCIINFGYVGALDVNLKKGDFVYPKNVLQHDYDTTILGCKPYEVLGQDKSVFQSCDNIYEVVKKVIPEIKSLEYIITGDRFVMGAIDGFEEAICDMEAYSIARCAYVAGVPVGFIKLVSDCCNDNGAEDFTASLTVLEEKLQKSIPNIVDTLNG